MPKLFISYRRRSWPFTYRLADELKLRLDAEIFVDIDGVDDDDFERSILRNLRASDAVLLVVTEHTFSDRIHREGDWVRREIREALTHDIPLVLVCVEGLLPPPELPDDISDVARKQGVNFYPEYFGPAVEKLADFVVKIGAAPYRQPDHAVSEPVQTVVQPQPSVQSASVAQPPPQSTPAQEPVQEGAPEKVAATRREKPSATPPKKERRKRSRVGWFFRRLVAVVLLSALGIVGVWAVSEFLPLLAAEEAPLMAVPVDETTLPERAYEPVSRNDNWQPFIREFDRVQMVLVPPGCFYMGDALGSFSERPPHEVCFEEPFWIDRYEVTYALYERFMGSDAAYDQAPGLTHPREGITWREASDFCEARGTRLPTEAEWEYAARGPDELKYPWGNGWTTSGVVWRGNAGGQTAPVGSKPAGISWVGAYDMSGNVWEWVSDWYGGYPSDRELNPKGPEIGTHRVLRGGSWDEMTADSLTTTVRLSMAMTRKGDWGVRCARSN